MKAAVLTGLKEVRLEERPDPEPRPGWVVVRTASASLCGTDQHQYDGRIATPYPRIPGHDFAGTVVSVGDGVDDRLVGETFAIKPSVPCGECAVCREGEYRECAQKRLMGLWLDGCLAEQVAVPRVNLVPVPAGVEAWQASLLEPLAVAFNAVDRLQVRLGDTVVVLGQGPIGLALTRMTALSGAGRLVVTDARDDPFDVSRAYGATDCVNVRETDVTEAVKEVTDGVGADIVIESSGYPDSSAILLDLVRKEGKVCHIGWADDLPPLPVKTIMKQTLTVYGVGGNGGRGQYERSLELIRSGRIDLDPVVTHRYPLDRIETAFETMDTKAGGAIKVLVTP